MTPNKLLIIDRLHKQYLFESMQEIQSQATFDFDFYSLQALLSNQLFIAGKDRIEPADYASFHLQEDGFLTHLQNTDQYGINYAFTSDYTHRILSAEMGKSDARYAMSCNYQNFAAMSDKRLFPMTMKLKIQLSDDEILTDFALKQINIDEDFEIPLNIPAKYTQISWQSMLKFIQSL